MSYSEIQPAKGKFEDDFKYEIGDISKRSTDTRVIGLTRLGIKPKSTAPEVDALTIRPSELLFILWRMHEEFRGREKKLNLCFWS